MTNLNPTLDLSAVRQRLFDYARQHGGGNYSVPFATDLRRLIVHDEPGCTYVGKVLRQPSRRTDWVGRSFHVPAGTRVLTNLALHDGGTVMNLDAWDLVHAYQDDLAVRRALEAQGRVLVGVSISASSEIIGWWGPPGSLPVRYDPVDMVTVRRIEARVPREQIYCELLSAAAGLPWTDDYPYYSDGSWGSLSLRGFDPDPRWGLKPSEMSKGWKDAHPDTLGRTCRWTDLAQWMPLTVDWIGRTFDPPGRGLALERVRFLRMEGTGHGELGRHTDITDKNSGTRDGNVLRFHVPLVTHPACRLETWELSGDTNLTHLARDAVWYLDARKPHAVHNPTPIDRVHLVVDAYANDRLRDWITSGEVES